MLELAKEVEDCPRHLGIHSGGMVICDRPVIEVCPVEWARMEDRSVLQWDKDDCAAAGLVKFDLLGLGMLTALHHAVDLVREHRGYEIDMAKIPANEPPSTRCSAGPTRSACSRSSRGPRWPRCLGCGRATFYDLVVEVALIRPGPIQGGSVHPYIRRRNGQEPVTYLHPLLEKSLAKTLGVPLFQEQLMQMAIDVAGFTPAESDELRQAMGSKRSAARMERLRQRLYEGMAANGITGDIADELFVKMKAFANYGFPESHSVSFALPRVRLVVDQVPRAGGVLRGPPQRPADGLLEPAHVGPRRPPPRRRRAHPRPQRLVGDRNARTIRVFRCIGVPGAGRPPSNTPMQRNTPMGERPQPAVRLGIGSVRGVGDELATTIEVERVEHGPYRDIEDLVRRVPAVDLGQLEAMATGGLFGECFGLARREALWAVGAVAQSRPDRLAGIVTGATAPHLPGMSPAEEAVADLWATGVSPDGHPTTFLRQELAAEGVVTAEGLWDVPPGARVTVAGVVTHRQRPMTAQGTTFLNLEDETGLINVVVSKGCWARFRRVAREAPAMRIRGRLERSEGVINLVAEHLEHLVLPARRSTPAATSLGPPSVAWTAMAPQLFWGVDGRNHRLGPDGMALCKTPIDNSRPPEPRAVSGCSVCGSCCGPRIWAHTRASGGRARAFDRCSRCCSSRWRSSPRSGRSPASDPRAGGRHRLQRCFSGSAEHCAHGWTFVASGEPGHRRRALALFLAGVRWTRTTGRRRRHGAGDDGDDTGHRWAIGAQDDRPGGAAGPRGRRPRQGPRRPRRRGGVADAAGRGRRDLLHHGARYRRPSRRRDPTSGSLRRPRR